MARQVRDYTTVPLDESSWNAFAALVEANNGVWGGCWCMGFHPEGVGETSLFGSEKKRTIPIRAEV